MGLWALVWPKQEGACWREDPGRVYGWNRYKRREQVRRLSCHNLCVKRGGQAWLDPVYMAEETDRKSPLVSTSPPASCSQHTATGSGSPGRGSEAGGRGVSPSPCSILGSQHPSHIPSQRALPAPLFTLKMPMPGSSQPLTEAMKPPSTPARPACCWQAPSSSRDGLPQQTLPHHLPAWTASWRNWKSLRPEAGGQARLRGICWARHVTSVSPSAKWGQGRLPCWVPGAGGEGSVSSWV